MTEHKSTKAEDKSDFEYNNVAMVRVPKDRVHDRLLLNEYWCNVCDNVVNAATFLFALKNHLASLVSSFCNSSKLTSCSCRHFHLLKNDVQIFAKNSCDFI